MLRSYHVSAPPTHVPLIHTLSCSLHHVNAVRQITSISSYSSLLYMSYSSLIILSHPLTHVHPNSHPFLFTLARHRHKPSNTHVITLISYSSLNLPPLLMSPFLIHLLSTRRHKPGNNTSSGSQQIGRKFEELNFHEGDLAREVPAT